MRLLDRLGRTKLTKRKVLAEHTYLHRIENIIGNVMWCASKSILNAKPS